MSDQNTADNISIQCRRDQNTADNTSIQCMSDKNTSGDISIQCRSDQNTADNISILYRGDQNTEDDIRIQWITHQNQYTMEERLKHTNNISIQCCIDQNTENNISIQCRSGQNTAENISIQCRSDQNIKGVKKNLTNQCIRRLLSLISTYSKKQGPFLDAHSVLIFKMSLVCFLAS